VLDDAVRREAVRTLRADEVVLTACRAGGPGGQHVNKTSSAVRAHHPASGLSVRVSDERSQHHNARIALERLATSLAELAEERVRRERAEERLRHYRVERGRPAFVYESAPDGGLRHAT
jgi:protein subunit release factor B